MLVTPVSRCLGRTKNNTKTPEPYAVLSPPEHIARMDILVGYTRFVRGMKLSLSMELAVMFGVAQRDIGSVT